MSKVARWRTWLRRPFLPRLEELEKRELPSAAPPVHLPPDLAPDRWPAADGAVRFAPLGQGDAVGMSGAYRFGAPTDSTASAVPQWAGAAPLRPTLAPQRAAPVPAPPPAGAVVIDAAWLARRGPGPYLLDQAGATY